MGSQLLKRVSPTLRRAHSLSLCSASSSDDIVSSVASILTNHRSKSRWPTILNHCPRGLTPLQASQVLVLVRHNPNLAAAFFRFTCENAVTPHDLHSFSTIIHIVARARKNSRAITLMRTAILAHEANPHALFLALARTYESCHSSPLVFDLLLRVYLDLNRIDSCLYMLKMLPSDGFQPSLTTCNRLVSDVARHKGFAVGFDLYKDLFGDRRSNRRPPNVATFNGLLDACFRERVPDKALEILMEMRRLNCEPNYKTYNILLAAYCEEGAMVKATELWEEMKSKGVARDIVAYNTLIAGWCKIGDVRTGEDLYNEMKVAGIQANYVTFQHLIIGHCKFGDVGSACLVFEEMCRMEFSPDGFIVDLLVAELCKKGMVSQALQVFRQATKDADFGSRRSTYESLIKGLCGDGEMEEALKLQAEMVGKGFEPDHSVYAAFVDGYTKLGKLDMADKLREEMNRILGLRGD